MQGCRNGWIPHQTRRPGPARPDVRDLLPIRFQRAQCCGMNQTDSRGRRRHTLRAYLKPRTLVMLALGFSSGLPFLLVGNTFGFWLRDEGTTLTSIGIISWVGIAYSLQFLWAPILDRVPSLKVLGQRRGWMVLSQLSTAAGLLAMAFVGTRYGLGVLSACAL